MESSRRWYESSEANASARRQAEVPTSEKDAKKTLASLSGTAIAVAVSAAVVAFIVVVYIIVKRQASLLQRRVEEAEKINAKTLRQNQNQNQNQNQSQNATAASEGMGERGGALDATTPVDVVWTLACISKQHMDNQVIASLASIFERATSPRRVRVTVALYAGESGEEHSPHTCPLLHAYRKYCANRNMICYAACIDCQHAPSSHWRGRYAARYDCIARCQNYRKFDHHVEAKPANEASSYTVFMDERAVMVNGWESHCIAQVALAEREGRASDMVKDVNLNSSSTARSQNEKLKMHRVVLTCIPPTSDALRAEMARNRAASADVLLSEKQRLDDLDNLHHPHHGMAREENGADESFGRKFAKTVHRALDTLGGMLDQDAVNRRRAVGAEGEDGFADLVNDIAMKHPDDIPGTWTRINAWSDALNIPFASCRGDGEHDTLFLKNNHSAGGGARRLSPVKTHFYSSRFAFGDAKAFSDVPDDPRLLNLKLHDGVDFIQGVRLMSHGWNLYHPFHIVCVLPTNYASSARISAASPRVITLTESVRALIGRYVNHIGHPHDYSNKRLVGDDRPILRWQMFGAEKSVASICSDMGVDLGNQMISLNARHGLCDNQTQAARDRDITVKYGSAPLAMDELVDIPAEPLRVVILSESREDDGGVFADVRLLEVMPPFDF
jgi:hypothetical protein